MAKQKHLLVIKTVLSIFFGLMIFWHPGNPTNVLAQTEPVPIFERDSAWPKPLPNNWRLGIVWGVAVDSKDNVWVLHAADNYRDEIDDEAKVPAPPVIAFDPEGNVIQAWGGRDQGFPWFYRMDSGRFSRSDPHPHPVREHALNVDHNDNIWISGGGHLVLKFSPEGKFLLQLGELGKTSGSNHTRHLGNPSNVDFDPRTNEVYVADGYINKRVIVFDADTGAYKRHWGRYGDAPDDSFEAGERPAWDDLPGPTGLFPRFAHGANIANDGLVYVADRAHNLIHIYQPDGTFVSEAATPGPVNSVAFSHDQNQYYLYGAGINEAGKIYIMRRSDLAVLGEFDSSGQHFFDTDSQGNLFTCGLFLPEKHTLKEMPAIPTR